MPKFPIDAPIRKIIRAFERLGFQLVREGNHISMARENPFMCGSRARKKVCRSGSSYLFEFLSNGENRD
jgi:hypothetical protein